MSEGYGKFWRVLGGALVGLTVTCVGPPQVPEVPLGIVFPLRISVSRPSENVVVRDDNPAEIRWGDLGPSDLDGDGQLNDPPAGSTVAIYLDPDQDNFGNGNEILLVGPVDAVVDTNDDLSFDGLDSGGDAVAAGTYYVVGQLDDGAGELLTDTSLGTIRLPLVFVEPAGDAEIAEAGDSVSIVWESDDADLGGNMDLGLDVDLDHTNDNETLFLSGRSFGGAGGSFALTGDVISTNGIGPGTYYLFARIQQLTVTLEYMYVTAPIQVTVGAFGPPSLEFVGLDSDVEFVVGDVVRIQWTDEDADDNATIELFVDPYDDQINGNELPLNDTPLFEDPDGASDGFDWDTSGWRPAIYRVLARISDGSNSVDVASVGRILLRSCATCPVITLTAPASDVDGSAADEVLISWKDDVWSPQALISLTYDDDPIANEAVEAGDAEVLIKSGINAIPDGPTADGFWWDLRPVDLTKAAVPAGTYYVFAYIDKDSAPSPPDASIDGYDVAAGTVVVPNTPPQLEFTVPGDSDETLIIGDDAQDDLTIQWRSRDADDAISISLFLDLDSNHANGNEYPITSTAIPAAAGPQTGSFDWTNGGVSIVDSAGRDVPPGRYTLLAEVDDGENEAVTVAAVGQVVVQSAAGAQASIVLEEPADDVTAVIGQKITISWRDENTTSATKIRLRYDDDPVPLQAVETNADEEDINETLIAAQPDTAGADRFLWDWHPDPSANPANILKPAVPRGEYTIFGYIGVDPDTAASAVDVADGRVVVLNTKPELVFTTPGAADVNLPEGALLADGLAFNYRDPEDAIQVKLFVDPDQTHNNGNEAQIVSSAISLAANPEGGGVHEEDWTGLDNAGQVVETGRYFLFAQVEDFVNATVTVEAVKKVNVVPDPSDPSAVIVLATPATNTTRQQGQQVAIAWADFTVSGSETVTLVYSTSATASELVKVDGAAGEVGIALDLPGGPDGASDAYTWNTAGVPLGTYYVHGKILAGAVVQDVSTARGTVEIQVVPVTPTLQFLQPATVRDLNFADGSTLDIVWQYRSSANGTLSLFVDRDTTNTNGNEIFILDNHVQSAAPSGTTDSLAGWDLTDTAGDDLPTGKYYIRGVLNVPAFSLVYATAAGQIKVRKAAGSPLVDLTAPVANRTFPTNDSQQVQITWQADDPGGDAEVFLWYGTLADADDEPDFLNPAGGGPITKTAGGLPQGVPASNGAFTWSIAPGDLGVGSYYIHAVIGGGNDFTNDDDRATAQGKLIVTAP